MARRMGEHTTRERVDREGSSKKETYALISARMKMI